MNVVENAKIKLKIKDSHVISVFLIIFREIIFYSENYWKGKKIAPLIVICTLGCKHI